jgi:acyl dehydratase
VEEPRDYRVVAHNTATASTNKIHDDAVARAYGFGGGLVPGVDVYAYMTHPPAAAWGLDWLARGSFRARFLSPAYEGDELTVAVSEVAGGPAPRVSLEVRKADGTVCATGEAGLPEPAAATPEPGGEAAAAWREALPPDPSVRPPAASPATLAAGTALAIPPHTFHAAKAGEYLADVREGLPLYAEAGVAHPGWLVRDANYVLSANVALGPWIHVESVTRHHGLVTDGTTVEARATVLREWERKGHRFVELDVGIFGDDRLVTRVTHTAIHTPRRSGA